MHIVLLILKIIGIVLLAILGILLALVLLILFVPVRYRVNVEKIEAIKAKIKISWLGRILYFSGYYLEEEFIYCFRIFGIIVFTNKRKEKKKEKVRKVSKEKKQKNTQKDKVHNIEDEKNSTETEVSFCSASDNQNIDNEKPLLEYSKESRKKDNRTENKEGKRKKYEEDSLFKRISKKIKEIFLHSKEKIKGIILTIKNIVNNIRKIVIFFQDESNQEGLKELKNSFTKTLKYVFPKKIKGYIRFGTEDPCITGQVTGIIAMVYSIVGEYFNEFKITPDFEEEVLEYKIEAKGSMRFFGFIRIGLRLWFHRGFKQLRKNLFKLKEEL